MKACSYCGKEYPDDVTICAIDGQRLVSNRENSLRSIQSFVSNPAFDINVVSPMRQSGKHRVFVEKNDLIFIPLENRKNSLLEVLAHLLGPVGNIIPLVLWVFSKEKTKVRLKQIQEISPEELLHENDAAFKLHSAEIRKASIEPPSLLAYNGKAGRLNLVVRHDEKFKFEFFDTDGLVSAIHWLKPFLGSTLEISPLWNEEKLKFEKGKKRLTH